MSRKKIAILVMSLSLLALLALPVLAQDGPPPPPENAIASGLNSPFGINYDADGNLYIADGGTGGAIEIPADPEDPTSSPGSMGFTGQILVVSPDGEQSVALGNLISMASGEGNFSAFRVFPQADSLWIVLPGGASGPQPFYGNAVMEIDKTSGRIKTYIDMFAFELANNPDEADPIDSNTTSLAWDANGALYIIDTGGNDILTWSADAGLSLFKVWKDDPVPTDLVFADDGSLYVSFLGQGIAPGAGHIEHWSADGQTLIETFSDLTAVTDIAIGQDGKLYAVQLLNFGEQGPMPNSGSVVEVSADGTNVVADGLNFPYSIAQAPDGSWAVSVNTTFSPPNSGAVVTTGGM